MNYLTKKIELIHSLGAIFDDAELLSKLRVKYGTEYEMIKAGIEDDMIKDDALALITELAPVCYKMNDLVLLKGDTSKKRHDFIGDESYESVVELFDMSTEIKTGDSCSFYVSHTCFFQLASYKEMKEVRDFLANLYKKD